MTADLVASTSQAGAEDVASLEALDPQSRELAVTRWLSDARVSLAHALETSDPAQVANFKAQVATVAEATKQLGLSKEIQLDAVEMVRRAERGVGLAIRKGQAERTVTTRRDGGWDARNLVNDARKNKTSPSDFMIAGTPTHETYAMTDGVSDDDFEDAIAEAKAEENLSRANVVRKIKTKNEDGLAGTVGRRQRADLIADLAKQGYSSRQMPSRVGVSDETIRQIARDFDIDIPADKIISRRRLNHTDMVEATVIALADSVSAINFIDFSQVDRAGAAQWATSLTESIAALKRFHNKIKELTQ